MRDYAAVPVAPRERGIGVGAHCWHGLGLVKGLTPGNPAIPVAQTLSILHSSPKLLTPDLAGLSM
jgi:hypothetical protein